MVTRHVKGSRACLNGSNAPSYLAGLQVVLQRRMKAKVWWHKHSGGSQGQPGLHTEYVSPGKVPTATPDNLSSIHGTHIVEGENQLQKRNLDLLICAYTHTYN